MIYSYKLLKYFTESSLSLGVQKIQIISFVAAGSNFLLFDLGGGTLDVCIFKIQKKQLKIISRSGDPNIGGWDFDNLLIKYFQEKLVEDYGIQITESKRYKLMLKCQSIKENLSTLEKDR